jgi:hypothetical protein
MTTEDDTARKSRFARIGKKLDEEIGGATRRLDAESDRMINYLNDEVVPAIRQGSSRALRTAAEQLTRLAEFMERNRRGK